MYETKAASFTKSFSEIVIRWYKSTQIENNITFIKIIFKKARMTGVEPVIFSVTS
jgi:hypothetical protein